MTWTRTERAALDYVIAQLEAGLFLDVTPTNDLPKAARDAVLRQRISTSGMADHEIVVSLARLALYLRLLRRVEAWESRPFSDWPDWTCPRYQAPRNDGTWVTCDRVQHGPWVDGCGGYEECRLAPWHPLWLDAPPYDPAVTPRMRREAR